MMTFCLTSSSSPGRAAELGPLGQVQHHLGAEQGLLHAGHLGESLAWREPGLRVIDPYVGTMSVQMVGHGQRGGVAGIVGAGLERRAEHGDPLAVHVSAGLVDGQLGQLGPLAVVDRLDGPDQVAEHAPRPARRRSRPALDVLGQAAAAEAQSGVEEPGRSAGRSRERPPAG